MEQMVRHEEHLKNRDHRSFLNPRPAPKPPASQAIQPTYAQNAFSGPRHLSNHGMKQWRPLPYLKFPPPAKPLPIPPIEPGTSRRLSQEVRYFQQNKRALSESTSKEVINFTDDDSIVYLSRPLPSPPVPEEAREATSRFSLATSELRAHTSLTNTGKASFRVPLRATKSYETVLSDSSHDDFTDRLSTIDEKSETRSIMTVIRGGQPLKHSCSNLVPVLERLSIEGALPKIDEKACLDNAIRARCNSAPSALVNDSPQVDRFSGDNDPGHITAEVSWQNIQSNLRFSSFEDPFSRQPAPNAAVTGTCPYPTTKKRARSFGDLEANSPGLVPAPLQTGAKVNDSEGRSGRQTPENGKCVKNDTPIRHQLRARMRQHQQSFLDIEHVAFGGPPHRDVQQHSE